TRADGTECEAVLWDFAGQPDYRLIHALFLDDIDLALVLFDPTHQQEPLKGVEYWLKQLQYNQDAACQTILVGARVDRGSPSLTQEELQSFCQRHHISQGYLLTSALTNEGLTELMSRVRQALQWELMPATITTLTFRRIKEFVLTLKEDTSGHKVLWRPTELRARLERIDPNWQFNDAELLTALQHLSNHGYVSLLRTSAGERMVLLMPDMLTNLASSLVLEARRNEKGLGALEENRILHGDYPLPELNRLGLKDRETLLDATLALFLERTLCFRESVNGQSFLVFPALINQKRPATDDFETIDDISYIVSGAIENLYAALVVLLGYTNTFTRVHQWQNQAIYEMGTGQLCGFRKVEEREGELELVLFYSSNTQEATKILFKSLFERFLQGREVSMTAYPPITCSICGYLQERSEVTKRLQAEKAFMFCGECGGKVSLIPQPTEEILAPQERQTLEQEQTSAQGRAEFAKALVWVKGYLRDHHPEFKPPVCFISYAWGVGEHERWVKNLAEDMLDAGLEIILDDWDNSMFGSSVSRFISRIESCDFIVVVATPLFLDKYINKVSATGSVVAAEVDLIQQRLLGTEEDKNTVIPLLLDGEDRNALPPLLRGRAYGDFREQHFYFARLFDLILTLYRINFRDPAVRDLRDELRTEAQRN
ncbi:MAG: TIR domain-containing protein, partial [Pseudomonadota bacterium]|nr:TIR domain-containing protein [Pseudomonadota bacterium]